MTNPKISLLESSSELEAPQDLESARITGLQETLGYCTVTQLTDLELDFSERVPVKMAADRFLTYGFRACPTLYVEPRYGKYDEQSAVEFVPRIARSGKNSAHGVFFGDIHFSEVDSLAVAVKPHTDEYRVESALYDHLNSRAITELGFYSLQPVGIVTDGDRSAYSLTLLEETLTTLDSIDWSDFYPNTDNHPGMKLIWSQIARQVALLHSKGSLSHGDLAGRNIAITAENYAFLIDWERAHISLTTPRDAEVRYEFSHPDLAMLLETFCRPPNDEFRAGLGIFYGKDGDWWQGFCELFLDEYFTTRQALADELSDKPAKLEIMSELEVLDCELQKDMERALDYHDAQRGGPRALK